MGDILELTYGDYVNYKALCAAIEDIPWKMGKRRYGNDTLSTGAVLNKIYEQGGICVHCGVYFGIVNGVHKDTTTEHVIPFRYGSKANNHNTLVLHHRCNLERNRLEVIPLIEEHYGKVDVSMVETFVQPMTYREFTQC